MNFDEILFLDKILTFRKLRIVTDLNKSEFKNAQKNTCQTMLVMHKKKFKDSFIVEDFKIIQSVLKSKYFFVVQSIADVKRLRKRQ